MAERTDPTAAAPDRLLETAPDRWERTLAAFLVEKLGRSGSHRTAPSYAGLLRAFFGRLGKTPEGVTPADVVTYAHGVGASGRAPSPHTIGARITALTSFFQFCVRLELIDRSPCDRVERPRPPPSTPRGA